METEISYISNLMSTPRTIDLWDYLESTRTKHTPLILDIHEVAKQLINTESKEVKEKLEKEKARLKKQLHLIVPASTIWTRAKEVPLKEKLIAYSGYMMFDIDPKENINLLSTTKHAQIMRDELTKIDSVSYCALSCSGIGVWGLFKIQYPEKIKQHFDELMIDFKNMGIILDSSKGGNPTDLRYFSTDPDAYINQEAKTYTKLFQPPQPAPKPTYYNHSGSKGFINTIARMIDTAPDGGKHETLLKAARLAGGYVAGGAWGETEAYDTLYALIMNRDVSSESNASKTIRDGLRYGLNSPIKFI